MQIWEKVGEYIYVKLRNVSSLILLSSILLSINPLQELYEYFNVIEQRQLFLMFDLDNAIKLYRKMKYHQTTYGQK